MTVVIGLPRDDRAKAALDLGAMLARSLDVGVVVATVMPEPWPTGYGTGEVHYQELLEDAAKADLARAREELPADVPAEFLVIRARSTAAGLIDLAEERDGQVIALGSSSAGALGRVTFGSVAERLLHSSPIPVALAPRGYRARPGAKVSEVTAAFSGGKSGDELVLAVAGVAAEAGATLRIASFAVRPRTPLTAGLGPRAEDDVLAQWVADVQRGQLAVGEQVAKLPRVPATAPGATGVGASWGQALEDIEWPEGSVLAVGSSTEGPVARVFIGSRASKIARHSPVPVVVLPRQVTEVLAEMAELP